MGCGQNVDNSGKAVLRMNLDEGLASLDPASARDRARVWMCAQLFSGLVELDSALALQPALARAWEIDPSGRVYTFRLRRDVLFHEDACFGPARTRRLTAADVAYSFTRICDPATASTGKWIFSGKIQGLDAWLAGQAPAISGFEVLNDSTFRIHLLNPFPPFLSLLAMPYGYVVPKEAVEAYGPDFRAHPVGTGPFRLFRWDEGRRLVLHRNPAYFEPGLPHLDAVSVQFIPSRLSAFIQFVQGRLDFIGDLDASYKDEIFNPDGSIDSAYAARYQILPAPQLNTEYLGMLADPALPAAQASPLADLRVRQALSHAIDREKLVRYLLNGMGTPAEAGMIPEGLPGFSAEAVRGYPYDPARARALLAAAGYDGRPLVLYSTPKYAAMTEFVQKSFEQIGVKLEIRNLQGGALRKEVYSSNAAFWRASWIADYPDGENYLSLFYSRNASPVGPNTTHFQSPAFDRLYEAALRETRDSVRQRLYQQMDQLVMDAAPVIPLYYDRSFRMLQPWVKGLSSNPMNHLSLKRVQMLRR
ncbi:MAG: ABC transporter substrate-binding protein [Bacteroidia bacterium]|nr:ABC transporter substrate-binding protein [Bacteroidia bacterium]